MKDFFTRAGLKGARSRSGCILLLFLLAAFFVWPSQSALAANRQWTGDDSGLWSDPDNWFPAGVPQNGDMTFTAGGDALNRTGTNIVFTGTNGLPGANYTVLTATNVTLPLSNWVGVLTNHFDALGRFQITNPVTPAERQRYFRLLTP